MRETFRKKKKKKTEKEIRGGLNDGDRQIKMAMAHIYLSAVQRVGEVMCSRKEKRGKKKL